MQRRWFLSYNTKDLALMQALVATLRQKDAGAYIFFAPKSLQAGGFWLPELAKEIAQSTAFVLLVGEKGVGHWQHIEYYEAFGRRVKEPNYPVILLLKEDQSAPGLPFLHQLHRIITRDPASEDTLGKLMRAADGAEAKPGELWRYTRPYRGLEAMTECDGEFFFGRGRETVEVIKALAAERGKLPILLGNSGVGKSSLAQAGVVASLVRQAWPQHVEDAGSWPAAFEHSRQWCFLTLRPGTDPLKALVEAFLDRWDFEGEGERIKEQNALVALLRERQATLSDLLDATERRYRKLARPAPPAFFLYIDQGEELYVRAEEHQRRRFSELLAYGVGDPRLYMLMSMRTDFLGELQKDEPFYKVHRQINVPPLREAELREVVSRPAELLSARFETDGLVDIITRCTAEHSVKGVGALPLLSYTPGDMWTQMVKRDDGVLRLLAQSFELGGVLVDRADAFLDAHPKSQDELRRIFTLKLATVRPDGEPMRRRALRAEFSAEEWKLVSELADHPNRLLVTGTLENGEGFAEVAHEAIFGRWDKLKEWIAAEREFLAWRSGLEAAQRTWQAAPVGAKNGALLMGLPLTQAQKWSQARADDLTHADRGFIARSIKHRRLLLTERAALLLATVVLVGLYVTGWHQRDRWLLYLQMWTGETRPLAPAIEAALKPGEDFQECRRCPEMVAVPAGKFMMGEKGEQHEVTISKPFAVSKSEVTFSQWDTCVAVFDCTHKPDDLYWGRGDRPVINVSWDDAKEYVTWLSKLTGKDYRLLSEAEWEYAARAGSTTNYFWGDDIKKDGKPMANCDGCGSRWDDIETAPVREFEANAFRLYDMYGNVWEWVEDCYHDSYNGAPTNGSAWADGDCSHRVVRGGAWTTGPEILRSASRGGLTTDFRHPTLGFRVGRTINP